MKQSISHPSALCTSMAIGIKWRPLWNLLYLQILAMVLSFATTPISQIMTFEATVSHVGVSNHHINNEDLNLLGHVQINS